MNKEENIQKIQDQIDKVKEYLEYGMPYSEYLDLQLAFDDIVNLIQKQSKIIDKMAEEILKIDTAKSKFEYDHAKVWDTEKGIKEYFKKVVDEDVKD